MFKYKYKKPSRFDFDLIIIGSGASGGVSANLASQKNKSIALIESHKPGGDAINSSVIPANSLLKFSETMEIIKNSNLQGISVADVKINLSKILAIQKADIDKTGINDKSKIFRSKGIKLIKGRAKFISPWTLLINNRNYSAKKIIIATGSHNIIPNIPGLRESGYITYKDIGSLTRIPKSIFIIGGGATAYEYAQIFHAFGAKVNIIETKRHILPKEDSEISDLVRDNFQKMGINVYTSAQIISIMQNQNGTKNIIFEQNYNKYKSVTELIMVAAGKAPNVDIDLQNANIHFTESGIITNRYLQTNQKHIFAIGDNNGRYCSANAAIEEAQIVIHNLYNRKKILFNNIVPQCMLGSPQIAVVGKTEKELRRNCQIFQTSISPLNFTADNFNKGFVKIIATHTGVIVGACIVAPNASEMIDILTLAIKKQMRACEIAKIISVFGSDSEAIKIASKKIKCI